MLLVLGSAADASTDQTGSVLVALGANLPRRVAVELTHPAEFVAAQLLPGKASDLAERLAEIWTIATWRSSSTTGSSCALPRSRGESRKGSARFVELAQQLDASRHAQLLVDAAHLAPNRGGRGAERRGDLAVTPARRKLASDLALARGE